MLKKILETYKSFENTTNYIIKIGLRFCICLCVISISILVTYLSSKVPITYYIGMSIFRLSIIFSIEFIICGFVVDGIKKQLI